MVFCSKAAIKREQSEARFDFAEREQARPIGQGGSKGHGREMEGTWKGALGYRADSVRIV